MNQLLPLVMWLSTVGASQGPALGPTASKPVNEGQSLIISQAIEAWIEPLRSGGVEALKGPAWQKLANQYRGQDGYRPFLVAFQEIREKYTSRPDDLLARSIVATKLAGEARCPAMGPGMLLWVDAAKLCMDAPETYEQFRTANCQFMRWLIFRCLNIKTPGDYPLWLHNFLQAFITVRDRSALLVADFKAAMKAEVPRAIAHHLMDGGHQIRERPQVVWKALSEFLKHELVNPCLDGDGPEITMGLLVRAYASARAKDFQDVATCLSRTEKAQLEPEWESVRLAATLRLLAGTGQGDKAVQLARPVMGQPALSPTFGQGLAFLAEFGSLPGASGLLAQGHYRTLLEGPGPASMLEEFVTRLEGHPELRSLAPWLLRLYASWMASAAPVVGRNEDTGEPEDATSSRLAVFASLASQAGLTPEEVAGLEYFLVMGPARSDGKRGESDDSKGAWQGKLENWKPPRQLTEMAERSGPKGGSLQQVSAAFYRGKPDEALRCLAAIKPGEQSPSVEQLKQAECFIRTFERGHMATYAEDHTTASLSAATPTGSSHLVDPDGTGASKTDPPTAAALSLIQHLLQSSGSLSELKTFNIVRQLILMASAPGQEMDRGLSDAWNALARVTPTEDTKARADRLFGLMDDRFDTARRMRISLWLASRLLREGAHEAADARARTVEEQEDDIDQRVEARVIRIMAAGSRGKTAEGMALATAAREWPLGALGRSKVGVAAGWLCLQSGDIAQGKKYLSEVAGITPPNAYTRRAAQMLERLRGMDGAEKEK